MDDVELNALTLLQQHGVATPRELHTYLGHVNGLGDLRFDVKDAGDAGEPRWSVDAYDSVGQHIAGHSSNTLAAALQAVFDTINSRAG